MTALCRGVSPDSEVGTPGVSLCYRHTAGNNREREVEGMHHAEWHMTLTNNMGLLLVFNIKDNATISRQHRLLPSDQ